MTVCQTSLPTGNSRWHSIKKQYRTNQPGQVDILLMSLVSDMKSPLTRILEVENVLLISQSKACHLPGLRGLWVGVC